MLHTTERCVMKILAVEHETPGITLDQFQPHLQAEARRAWELYQQGIIRELYFDRDQHSAVLILECDDLPQAQAALSTLPLVRAGLITFELRPLIPYSGFARLFTASA